MKKTQILIRIWGDVMTYSYKNKRGQMYYLHTQEVKLKSTGRKQRIFFFSKKPSGAIEMPKGYGIVENKRTGLPFLKRK